jgi:CBS domain-containing protein
MKVNEVMTDWVEVVHPDAKLAEAARKMKDLNVGSLPVCDGKKLLGMITDRDITVRAVAGSKDLSRLSVKEVMTPDVVYCFADQDVEEAAQIMADNQLRRLPVLNRDDHQMVGIVALADLAVEVSDEDVASNALEGISVPAHPNKR